MINISLIFIKWYNFPFTTYFCTKQQNCSLIPDKTRCLRASVATYLAFLAANEARVVRIHLSAIWTHCPDKAKSELTRSGEKRVELTANVSA